MALNWNNVWTKAKEPVLFTVLGALLVLSVKNCGDGNKARETNEIVKGVAENVDTIKTETHEIKQDTKDIKHDTDTLKAFAKATHKVVTRIEDKVDTLQNTADSILTKVEECCDCNDKKPEVRVRPVKRDTVPRVLPKPKRDTVPHVEPKKDTVEKTYTVTVKCYKYKVY